MSWQHIKAVWARSKSKRAARLVILCIADHANEEDRAWPSMATIARETDISERQVTRCINDLIAAGEIAIEYAGNGRGHSTIYHFRLPLEPIKGDIVSPNSQPEKGDISSIKGDMVSERVTNDTGKGDMVSPEVIREIPKERPEERGRGKSPANPFPFKPSPVKSAVKSVAQERAEAIMEVCSYDPDIPDHVRAADNAAAQLGKYEPDELRKRYARQANPNGTWYWYRDDWRGRKNEPPTPKTILETVAIKLAPGDSHATRQGNTRKDYPAFQPVTDADREWWASVNAAGQPDTS